jgi:pilus assembly protein TadC
VPAILAACAGALAIASLGARTDRRALARLGFLAPVAETNRSAWALVPRLPGTSRLTSARTQAARRRAVDRHVLDFVELLVAATEAGLPPAAAVQRSADLAPGPLGDELRRAAREIALGLDWRASLDEVSARTQSSSMRKLTVALARAHRLGTSAQASLRAISDELRTEHRMRAEEHARRAPVTMLFPLVFLILPAFLLLTVGPVLIATIRSLH